MTVDAYTVIAGARRRGWTEGMIARKLGLRDGQTGYGVMRQDADVKPIVVVPSHPPVGAARLAAAMYAPASIAESRGSAIATVAVGISIQAKCQGAPMTTVPTPMPTIPDLLRIMSDISGISVGELRSPRRARNVARPRQVVMWLARKHTPFSLPSIGTAIGNRDHTTIMHGARRVEAMLAEGDPFVGQWVSDAEAAIAIKFPHLSRAD